MELDLKTKALFVPFHIGEELNKMGFNDLCFAAYVWYKGKDKPEDKPTSLLSQALRNSEVESDLVAPTYQQAFDFLKEKYDFHGNVQSTKYDNLYEINYNGRKYFKDHGFETFEYAQIECINTIIDQIKLFNK